MFHFQPQKYEFPSSIEKFKFIFLKKLLSEAQELSELKEQNSKCSFFFHDLFAKYEASTNPQNCMRIGISEI